MDVGCTREELFEMTVGAICSRAKSNFTTPGNLSHAEEYDTKP